MNNDSLLHFAPYLFLLKPDSDYYLNYWISIPEGYKAGSPGYQNDSETGTKLITIEVVESSGNPAEIVKVEMDQLTNLEDIRKVKVKTNYVENNEAKEKSTVLYLENADETSVGQPDSEENILPYKPYGYLAQDAETQKYHLYYLFYSSEARDLHPATVTPSEGDKLYLGYTLDVVLPGDGRLYNGVTEVPFLNLNGTPYSILDTYVAILEGSNEEQGLRQPVNKGSVIIFYEDAD